MFEALWPLQVLVAIPVIFHIVRVSMGYSMDDAIATGWLMSGQARSQCPHLESRTPACMLNMQLCPAEEVCHA